MEMSRFVLGGLIALAVVLVAMGAWLGLAWAPPDREMGDVQRIMYAHVPSIWAGLLALTVNFAISVAYLFRNSWRLDALAEACAEVGVLFGANGVLLGAIWGRPTWGVWWDWDPRLTTAAIMLVAYTGYLTLRRFIEDPERRAVWSAVVAIVAFVDLPIVWFSVKWWRSLHQAQSTRQSVDPAMQISLLVNAVAFLCVAALFIALRYRIALRALEEEVALPQATSPEAAP
jgi:heme exporter protein C